jgi:hypothetical protein
MGHLCHSLREADLNLRTLFFQNVRTGHSNSNCWFLGRSGSSAMHRTQNHEESKGRNLSVDKEGINKLYMSTISGNDLTCSRMGKSAFKTQFVNNNAI